MATDTGQAEREGAVIDAVVGWTVSREGRNANYTSKSFCGKGSSKVWMKRVVSR